MRYRWQRILFHLNEFNAKRRNRYFGTSLYDELVMNPLPSLLLLSFATIALYLFIINLHFLSDFLFWFVGILEITKVLKIPFLDHIRYYQYLSLFIFFYISFSLLWDLGYLLSKWNVRIFLIRDELWLIHKQGFGKKLKKFQRNSDAIDIEWNHSGVLDLLGLNRVYWKKEDKELGCTSFFFPYKKNRIILDKILKR